MIIHFEITPWMIEVVCHAIAAIFYFGSGAVADGKESGAVYFLIFLGFIFTCIGAHQ